MTYVVNSTADEDDKNVGEEVCETAVAGKCTLRAAIEESNASTIVNDTIEFTSSFDGQLANTIAITLGEFPVITDQVTIDGDNGVPCDTQALTKGPCVGVSGSAGLDVNSNNVEIRGIAVSGAGTGINVTNKSLGFTAKDDWLGVKLNGSAESDTTGIFVDPGSNGALIGGVTEADRNVFANDGVGLDLEGASSASIKGNYFGVSPDGSAQAANSKDIEITDSTSGAGFKAVGNEVGLPLEAAAQATTVCDGGCNVISGASTGIDLEGEGAGQNEAPATGSTFIKGNFVGLSAAGTDVIANSGYGIYVGGADHVTIGGFSLSEANYVAGGSEGIASGSGGEDFVVRGHTEISRNRGSSNSGLFIDLVLGANEGIVTPSVSTALQSSATGVALPGATVRVFSKSSSAAGELKGFLGQTKADESGNWKLTYSTVSTGTLVTATQTNAFGATSELATAVAAATDPSTGGSGGGIWGPGPGNPPVPQTTIKKGPKAKSAATTAKFKFTSSVAGSRFECKLDKGKFKKCRSPKTYKTLKLGKHVFKVRAVGPTGLVDKSPAKRAFTVLQ